MSSPPASDHSLSALELNRLSTMEVHICPLTFGNWETYLEFGSWYLEFGNWDTIGIQELGYIKNLGIGIHLEFGNWDAY